MSAKQEMVAATLMQFAPTERVGETASARLVLVEMGFSALMITNAPHQASATGKRPAPTTLAHTYARVTLAIRAMETTCAWTLMSVQKLQVSALPHLALEAAGTCQEPTAASATVATKAMGEPARILMNVQAILVACLLTA